MSQNIPSTTENNSETLKKTITETGLDTNELVKRSFSEAPRGGMFIPKSSINAEIISDANCGSDALRVKV